MARNRLTLTSSGFAITMLLLSASAWGQLSGEGRQRSKSPHALDTLRQTVMATIAPDTWDEVGGDGSVIALVPWNLLVVSQTKEAHGEIHGLLDALQRAVMSQKGEAADSELAVYEASREENMSQHQTIRAELAGNTTFDFQNTPLTEVASYLEQAHGIEVEFDRTAMDEIGVAEDHRVSRSLTDVPLHSALDLLLGDHGLTYVVRHGVLLITTPEDAQSQTLTKVYDLSAIIAKQER